MANIFPIDFEEKLTMAQDDYILFSDSEDGNKIKKAQYKNLKWEKGDPWVNGTDWADWAAATITVWTTTTWAAGTSASVTNSWTSSAAVFNFTIPQGAKWETWADGKDWTDGKDGADWTSATITVGTTTTLPAWSSATVTNSGTSSAAVLNFGIPKGDKWDWSWDVNWPASSTDDNIATFDWATGKLIQDSWVSISDINTKTFTLSSTSDLTNAQAALDWYLNWWNPILYHERGYTNIPMPCTYHLRETRYRNSNYEYVFVSPAWNQDVDNLDWASESDTIFHCIWLSVADVDDEPWDTVLSIREFDIKGSDYFAKKADASKIEYVTQAEYNALLPWAESDNKHYFIYTESWPTPSMVSCDFTQGDRWFAIDLYNWSWAQWRDSNGWYKISDAGWGNIMTLSIPSSITNQWTPKQIKLYGKNMDLWSWVWISEWLDTKTVRVYSSQISISNTRWTPANTNVSPLNDDVFVIDFENEVCYLESATSTTATIYSSTILQLWTNGTLLIQMISPNNNTYIYLTKAEFYF